MTTRQVIDLIVSSAIAGGAGVAGTAGAAEGGPVRISYLNAHCSNLAQDHDAYRGILSTCDLVYADGQAVVWAARWLGAPVPERVNAGDFILDFCRACAEKGLGLYLLGSAEGVAAVAADAWRRRVPALRIVGTHSGYFDPGREESLAQEIRAARPDVLLTGMSAPRQEEWMAQWAGRLGVSAVWCVGALFEYYGGRRARAPVWVRRAGLEWLFRLVLEPRRLWKRYLVGNARFVWRVVKAKREKRRTPNGD